VRHILLGVMILAASPALAQEWRALSGAEIKAALTDRQVRYISAAQVFYADGSTIYQSQGGSAGFWDVRGDEYCSNWPPIKEWACYGVELEASGEKLRFVDAQGNYTAGKFLN